MKPLIFLVPALAAALALGNPYLINLLVVCALFALPAIGLSLLMGYTGQISLGHAAFVAVGAYLSTLLGQRLGLEPWLGVLIATGTSAIAAWCVGWLVFRLGGHHLAMATLAFGMIVHTVLVEWQTVTGGQDGLGNIELLEVFGFALYDDRNFYPLAWAACIAGLVLAHNLVRSPTGLAMRAVGENAAVAAALGIDAARVKRRVMALSGAYAGLGGALYAHWMGYISPDPFHVGFSIKLLLIVALGGFTGVWNVLAGTFFVVIVSEWLKPLGRFDVVIYGVLLIVAMIHCRDGLFATLARATRRRLPARPAANRAGPADERRGVDVVKEKSA